MFPALIFLAFLQTPATQPFIPSWAGLQHDYNETPLDPAAVQNVNSVDEGKDIKITFSFPGAPGDTVQGVLVEPKTSQPMPLAILLHGLGGNKNQMVQMVGSGLIDKGIAYAAIDLPGHGARETDDDQKVLRTSVQAFMANKGDLLVAIMKIDQDHKVAAFLNRAVFDGVQDNRHLLDYLTSRREIDFRHIGLIGDSLGSITGTIFGAVDDRVKDLLLMVGGDPALPFLSSLTPDQQAKTIPTCCSLYAPHFLGQVRMLNGTKDSIIPRSATDRLYNAFPESERTISWFNSDHFLPVLANQEAVEWTTDRLRGR